LKILAWDLQARVAVAEENRPAAEKAIKEGLTVLENYDDPVTGWMIHATACNFYLDEGDQEVAEAHRERAQEQILEQANTFTKDEPLRKSFLTATPVRRILMKQYSKASIFK
jgi:hypothetical protein